MPNEKRIADSRRSLAPTPYSRPTTMDIRSIVSQEEEDINDLSPRNSSDTRRQTAGSGRHPMPPQSMPPVPPTSNTTTRPSLMSSMSPSPVRPPLHTSPITHPGDATGTQLNPRRQAHILSEQKRRENINSGFEELKSVVPTCVNTTDSKALILRKAAEYIRNLQSEVERLKTTQRHDHPDIQLFSTLTHASTSSSRPMPSPPTPLTLIQKYEPHNSDVEMVYDHRRIPPTVMPPTGSAFGPQVYPPVIPVPPQPSSSSQYPVTRPTGPRSAQIG